MLRVVCNVSYVDRCLLFVVCCMCDADCRVLYAVVNCLFLRYRWCCALRVVCVCLLLTVVDYSMLCVVCRSLFVARWSSCVVRCALLFVLCWLALFVALVCYAVFFVGCVLILLFWCLLVVVCCLLFVVCCVVVRCRSLFAVVCCWLLQNAVRCCLLFVV